MENIQSKILIEYNNGNVVIGGIDGLYSIPLGEFIKQPADGILYDLNRNEASTLTNISDARWVNDYAVAKVIRALKNRIDELEKNQL